MIFYTYLWLREDGTPYYVGKTKQLRRTYGERHSVNPPPKHRIIIQEWPYEEDSYFAERFLIAYYGRKDNGTGVLLNHTDGGEGQSGIKQNAYTIEKRVLKTRGKKRTEEQKERMRSSQLGKINPSQRAAGKGHWNRGLVRSEETKEKIRQARGFQDMSNRIKTVCKRGHIRVPSNVSSNGTCKICKELLRKPRVRV